MCLIDRKPTTHCWCFVDTKAVFDFGRSGNQEQSILNPRGTIGLITVDAELTYVNSLWTEILAR
jgi:hypothetical protein